MAQTEVLIIGCGIAGATAALRLARNPDRQITVITRAPDPHESNTRYAQGGIIGRGPGDSSESLLSDILAAGAGVSSPQAARILAEEGPSLLHEILEQQAGVGFDRRDNGEPVWGQEAAHSHRRILHVGDSTGRSISEGTPQLYGAVPIYDQNQCDRSRPITFPPFRDPLDNYGRLLATVFCSIRRSRAPLPADITVLATGGLGRIYRNTTNPPGSRGDGWRWPIERARITNAGMFGFIPQRGGAWR